MGNCSSSGPEGDPEELRKNEELNRKMEEQDEANRKNKRLLFLGTGGSGKSTFMKQIIAAHGEGFSDKEKEWWKGKAISNIVLSAQILCTEALSMEEDPECKVDFESAEDEEQYITDLEALNLMANSLSEIGSCFKEEQRQTVERVWKHTLTQMSYANRGDFAFDFGDIEYFFNKLDVLSDPQYVMSHDDITYVRSKTSGVYEQSVVINGFPMTFIDVAGQRSSRKKWIGCFSDVTAVIWISALSNYNEVLPENTSINAMDDALEAFEWAVNHHFLQSSVFVVFLNKIDLLQKMVTENPEKYGLKNFFEHYDGDNDNADQSAEFIKQVFLSCAPEDRDIPIYTVQGTDTTNANKVLNAVIYGILEDKLSMFG